MYAIEKAKIPRFFLLKRCLISLKLARTAARHINANGTQRKRETAISKTPKNNFVIIYPFFSLS